MSETIYIIYKHTCSVNGKAYIGQTNNYNRRTSHHKSPTSGCIAFRNAIKKYGWAAFTSEVLASNLNLEEANRLETYYIGHHNTIVPNGYNLSAGGDNKTVCEESRIRMSLAKKGKPKSDKEKARIAKMNRDRAHPMSEEHKQKMQSPEVKDKRKAACAAFRERRREAKEQS